MSEPKKPDGCNYPKCFCAFEFKDGNVDCPLETLTAGRNLEGRAKQVAFNITQQLINAERTIECGSVSMSEAALPTEHVESLRRYRKIKRWPAAYLDKPHPDQELVTRNLLRIQRDRNGERYVSITNLGRSALNEAIASHQDRETE